MPSYIALLRKEPDADYGVEFPDFPGCISAGKDLEEARAMAEEALELHLEGMIADSDPIPALLLIGRQSQSASAAWYDDP